ncbi:MAG: hypothetical protein GY947_13770 [Rhodobacteraceae bacterium]|nr:hypothetical protein [Paracoccaceae bacterium]
MQMIAGETYKVRHSRKGEFYLQVTTDKGEWIDGVLVSGRPNYMNPDNQALEGEKMTVRRSFLTPLEHIPNLPT